MIDVFVVKETRAGETRVALTPREVALLCDQGFTVAVEAGAGAGIGVSDAAYRRAGAHVDPQRSLASWLESCRTLVRVKRARRERELQELKSLQAGTQLVGFLDVADTATPHISEWEARGVVWHSLDRIKVDQDSPMNVLGAMSELAGSIAVSEAIALCPRPVQTALIVGFGAAGKAAAGRCESRGIAYRVVRRSTFAPAEATEEIGKLAMQADIVICSARSPSQAPLLLTAASLAQLQPGTVVVDLARTEGGNVEGSQNDRTLTLSNGVLVTNSTGYPKKTPVEASERYAQGLLAYLDAYILAQLRH